MPRREHFDAGHGKPEHSFETLDRGDDYAGEERYKMLLHTPDYPGAASVTYDTYIDDYNKPVLDVSYLKSNIEGKGHARKLMENLYNSYPRHAINWGRVIHPAAAKLASEFEDKHYNRTTWYSDDDF